MVSITDTAGLARLRQYETFRDAPRNAMAHGVYPNALVALAHYATLTEWLADPVNADFAGLHTTTVGAVLPHVQTMLEAMQVIIGTMQAIEAAAPGTFGIAIPEEAQE